MTTALARAATPTKRRRPGGVTLVALLNLALAAVYALALSPWDPLGEIAVFDRLVPVTSLQPGVVSAAILIFGVIAHLSAGVGLLLLKPWAWRLTILITGLSLAIYLWVDFFVGPVSLRLALYAAIAFYLNSAAVRDAFTGTHDSESTVG